jgi:hypothetical protein
LAAWSGTLLFALGIVLHREALSHMTHQSILQAYQPNVNKNQIDVRALTYWWRKTVIVRESKSRGTRDFISGNGAVTTTSPRK